MIENDWLALYDDRPESPREHCSYWQDSRFSETETPYGHFVRYDRVRYDYYGG